MATLTALCSLLFASPKWLGIAGWEIQTGQTVILIDPFLTRKEPDRTGGERKPAKRRC